MSMQTQHAYQREKHTAITPHPGKQPGAVRGTNQLEKLAGDRQGQYSVSVNEQWRICFRWEDGDAFEIEIVDYH
jgi:plasmid maintenance system killer protein